MDTTHQKAGRLGLATCLALVAPFSACTSMPGASKTAAPSGSAQMASAQLGGGLRLTGDQQVPPVATSALGAATIAIADDGSVRGAISTVGLSGTMAHIHIGAPGVNGPPIITLSKAAQGEWLVPPGSRLTAEQLKVFRAGGLYVNVHSEAYKDGEIRTQLRP